MSFKWAGRHRGIGGGAERARYHIAKFTPAHQQELAPLVGYYESFMSYMNPPKHTEQRGCLSEVFTGRVIENLRPAIQKMADDLLEEHLPRGRMDILSEFALPLSSSIIVDMLGVPRADRSMFVEWINRAFAFLGSDQSDFALARRALDTYLELSDYLRDIVEARRQHPCDDLITEIVRLQQEQPEIPDQRILSLLITVIHGGWKTTMTLISNGLFDLLSHPAQSRKLRENLALVNLAVEEVLRFDGPFKGVTRVAQEDFSWEGRSVKKGNSFVLLLAAANRDPNVFADPHHFDITRQPNPHLAFGVGIHYCLGAPLAQLEAQVAFTTVLKRLPELRLAGDSVRWADTRLLRQLEALPVEF